MTIRLLASMILMASVFSVRADFEPYDAEYILEKQGTRIAIAKHQLRTTGDVLQFSQFTELSGFLSLFRDDTIHEDSGLRLGADSWRLTHYLLRQTGDAKRRDTHFDVEWNEDNSAATTEGTYIDDSFALQTEGEIWDPLSMMLALRRDAAADATEFRYQVVHKGDIKEYLFEREGEDQIEIDLQVYDCVIYTRVHGRRTTKMWLSEQTDLVPVRIEQYKDGELNTSMTLSSLREWNDDE